VEDAELYRRPGHRRRLRRVRGSAKGLRVSSEESRMVQ
jgi:hypothetical protein